MTEGSSWAELETMQVKVPSRFLTSLSFDKELGPFDLDGPIASFDPHSFILNVGEPELPPTSWPKAKAIGIDLERTASSIREKLSRVSSLEERVGLAVRETAWLHERQHFSDTLCTPAGAFMFIREARTLHNLAVMFAAHASQGHIWRGPIAAFAGQNSGEEAHMSRHVAELFLQRNWFNGDTSSFVLSHDPELQDRLIGLLVDCDEIDEALNLPYYPKTVMVDGVLKIHADPLGFRALTEARAIFVQNELIYLIDEELVHHYIKSLHGRPEYSIANMLFTKACKYTGAIHRFENIAESSSHFWRWLFHSLHGGGPDGSLVYPGQSAISIALSSIDERGLNHETYSEGEIRLNNFVQDQAQSLISYIAGKTLLSSFVTFALENIIIPGLVYFTTHDDHPLPRDWPMEENFIVEDRHGATIFRGQSVPQPFGYFDGSVARVSDAYRDSWTFELVFSWFCWIAFRANLAEAWIGGALTCPLATGRYSKFMRSAGVRLCRHCPSGEEEASCGTLTLGESRGDHVQCPWSQMVCELGFAKAS